MQRSAHIELLVIGIVLAGACVGRSDSASNLLLNLGA